MYNYKSGQKVTCIMDNALITNAKIQIQDGNIFICQNIQNGNRCSNRLGYRYSWCIDNGSKSALRRNDIEKLAFVAISQTELLRIKGLI